MYVLGSICGEILEIFSEGIEAGICGMMHRRILEVIFGDIIREILTETFERIRARISGRIFGQTEGKITGI